MRLEHGVRGANTLLCLTWRTLNAKYCYFEKHQNVDNLQLIAILQNEKIKLIPYNFD